LRFIFRLRPSQERLYTSLQYEDSFPYNSFNYVLGILDSEGSLIALAGHNSSENHLTFLIVFSLEGRTRELKPYLGKSITAFRRYSHRWNRPLLDKLRLLLRCSWPRSTMLVGNPFTAPRVDVTVSSSTGYVEFSESNGTHSWVIHLPPRYINSNVKVALNVAGASVTSSTAVKQTSIGSNTVSANYILFSIIIMIVIVAIVGEIHAINRMKE